MHVLFGKKFLIMNNEEKNIKFVGDIHGHFSKLSFLIRQFDIKNSYIIQVGDFGVGFHKDNYYKTELSKVDEVLKKRKIELFVIRGNHDNPEWFKESNHPFGLDNILLLKDYSELTLNNKHFLFVGGAVSVDRFQRTPYKDFWYDEEFVLKLEHEFPYRDRVFDVVVTHTRPAVCGAFKGFNNINYYILQDADLKEDLITESNAMDKLWEFTKPKNWFYGHFHESHTIDHENTKFRCLTIDEFYEYEYIRTGRNF